MPRPSILPRTVRGLAFAAAIFAALSLPNSASACPKCKEAVAAQSNGQGLQRGFQYSILFMLAAPFGILTGLGGYFWWEVRRARRLPPTFPGEPSSASDPTGA